MLDKHWYPGVSHMEQPLYKPILDCIYWPVLGSFKNWNIIIFTNKIGFSEDFSYIHNIVLGGISDNMASLLQTEKYGAAVYQVSFNC